MATRKVEIGATGHTVRANIARIRKAQGITLRELADQLAGSDRPLSHNAISEIERGARRVDVDDLIALALALNATPNALLLPPTSDAEHSVRLTLAGWQNANAVWDWAAGTSATLVSRTGPRARTTAQLQLNSDPAIQDASGAPNIETGSIEESPSGDD